MITLGIGRMEIDWGKNNIFTDHSALFKPSDVKDIPYNYVDIDTGEPVVEMKEEVEEIHEDQQENEEVIQENRFGYVKEETETQIDEEEVDQEPKKKFSFFKKKEETEELEEENVEEEDVEDQEESTFLIKLLNGFIIVLVLVLVALVAFIAKEVLFQKSGEIRFLILTLFAKYIIMQHEVIVCQKN